mgnify:CR=1 FL=1
MTKKDYILIANAIREVRAHQKLHRREVDAIVIKLSDTFAADNPRFLALKFEEACGGLQ